MRDTKTAEKRVNLYLSDLGDTQGNLLIQFCGLIAEIL